MAILNTRHRRSRRPYHVFNRGLNKRAVFIDDADRRYFLYLVRRHLGQKQSKDARGRPLVHLTPLIAVVAYCLMTTHFHLIVWQRDPNGIAELMNRVLSAYTRYFNQRHGNTAPLFDGPVRAKPVKTREHFRWLVRYVHDNHPSGLGYEFSSHRAWADPSFRPGWLEVEPALKLFGDLSDYHAYLDKRARRKALDLELF
ncbi:MAG: transposase [Solirubrobacterales bacterium]